MWWTGPHPWMAGYGGGWMPFHGVFMVLFVIVTILVIAGMVRFLGADGERRSSGLDVLEQRYAKGEIDREEYLRKKHDLGA